MKIAVWNKEGKKALHNHAIDAKEAIASGGWFAYNPVLGKPAPVEKPAKPSGPADGIEPAKTEEPAKPAPAAEEEVVKPEIVGGKKKRTKKE